MVAILEEIVLEGTETLAADAQIALADDDAGLVEVDKLRLGSWIEIREDDEFTLRCKLTAIIESTGKYIFVNRTGMKVLERTRTQLALEFDEGHVRVLDDTLLFDRALDSVVSNLRKLKA
jgi:hypothetical protein